MSQRVFIVSAVWLALSASRSTIAGDAKKLRVDTVRLSPIATPDGPMILISFHGMALHAPYLTCSEKGRSYIVRAQDRKLVFTFTDKSGKRTVETCDEFVRPDRFEGNELVRPIPYYFPGPDSRTEPTARPAFNSR
jgi:hypothetical protein